MWAVDEYGVSGGKSKVEVRPARPSEIGYIWINPTTDCRTRTFRTEAEAGVFADTARQRLASQEE